MDSSAAAVHRSVAGAAPTGVGAGPMMGPPPMGRGGKGGSDSGHNGYLSQKDWVSNSVDAKTQLLDQYAAKLKGTADSVQQQDDA